MNDRNVCASCGKPLPLASNRTWNECDDCHRPICTDCYNRSSLFYDKKLGFIRVCQECAERHSGLEVKPHNPNPYVGE